MIENSQTGQVLTASQIPGLVFQGQTNFQNPNAQVQYPRGGIPYGDGGQQDITLAWVFGSIGLCTSFFFGLCCSVLSFANVFSILGIIFACRARNIGNPRATAPLIFSIVGLAIGPIITIFFFIFSRAMR